jgi:VanZ family protein
MLLIFGASTDTFSSRNTARVLTPLLQWFVPGISHRSIVKVHAVVRKTGHVLEYAVLAVLLLRVLRHRGTEVPRAWSWRLAGVTLALTALYAASDEFHQKFVWSRQGSAWDVALDTSGALLALVLVWGWERWRCRS